MMEKHVLEAVVYYMALVLSLSFAFHLTFQKALVGSISV